MSVANKKAARVPKYDCVSCGACVKVCPMGAIAVYRGVYAFVDRERCVGCGRCAAECPAGIIVVEAVEAAEEGKP